MNLWKDTYPIILSCSRHLTPCTAEEVARMGYSIIDRTDNTIVVRGNMRDVMRLNLQLRTAHRVLVPLLRTECHHLRMLYDAVYSIPWEELFDPDGYFTVNSVVWNESVRDTRMPSLKAKDAIADRMRKICGGRPDSGPETYGAGVFVHWIDTQLIVFLDTTVDPLVRRGYRKFPGTAPMQETLAAGCIETLGWDGTTPFVAPMCGSGTPAIEAAMIAKHLAPGLLKSHFGFMDVKGYTTLIPGEKASETNLPTRRRFGASPEEIWKSMVAKAKADEKKSGLPPIIANDIDPAMTEIASLNAIAAGVAGAITFSTCDFTKTPLPPAPATIFMNPEYGKRMGADEDLVPLYRGSGDFLKQRCPGYIAGVLTGSPELSHEVGLKTSRRVPFFNGPIECRMLVYDKLFAIDDKPAAPAPYVFNRTPPPAPEPAEISLPTPPPKPRDDDGGDSYDSRDLL